MSTKEAVCIMAIFNVVSVGLLIIMLDMKMVYRYESLVAATIDSGCAKPTTIEIKPPKYNTWPNHQESE